jgi:CheY-like chemotaxis protein
MAERICTDHGSRVAEGDEKGDQVFEEVEEMENQAERKHKVLIVDDEEDVRQVVRMTVKRALGTAEYLFASSGAEALEILRQQPGIALIVLDVTMETESAGHEVCRALREDLKNPYPRILLYTGYPDQVPKRQTIVSLDIDGYLPKQATTPARLYTTARGALCYYDCLVERAHLRKAVRTIRDAAQSVVGRQ